MKFQAVKGMRDFYPEQMRLRNYVFDAWRRVSLRNGFEEYDAPILEHLDLLTIKSGQEIAEQLFSLTDRGGRSLAIRPEITPSLARMVNAKINSLARPIKWFSVPRLCRAENPQKGRLREFFQWNVDVIGTDDVLADAECIFVLVDFLREIGLTPRDVQVRIGSRALAAAKLRERGVSEDQLPEVFALLDKRAKLSDEQFDKLCKGVGTPAELVRVMNEFEAEAKAASQQRWDALLSAGQTETESLRRLFESLESFGAADYCLYDPRIVRGLAYYTGIVYEAFDAGQSMRAIAGGGRYDNLLAVLGGPPLGATGFGMGDVVLGILLEEKGKLPALSGSLEYFVIDDQGASPEQVLKVLEVVGALRRAGRSADFSYARRPTGKQLKDADKRGARKAVLVRQDGTVGIKDLATGNQSEMPLDQFLKNPT